MSSITSCVVALQEPSAGSSLGWSLSTFAIHVNIKFMTVAVSMSAKQVRSPSDEADNNLGA